MSRVNRRPPRGLKRTRGHQERKEIFWCATKIFMYNLLVSLSLVAIVTLLRCLKSSFEFDRYTSLVSGGGSGSCSSGGSSNIQHKLWIGIRSGQCAGIPT